jgi:hypothetical protein
MMKDVETMPPQSEPETPHQASRGKLIGAFLLVAVAAFGLGYAPLEMKRRDLDRQLSELRVDLRLARLHRLLGTATVQAMRNDYPAATTAAVDFFAGCREAATLDLTTRPRTANALSAYASTRDEVVSLLAAGDPAAKERLTELFLAMDGVLQRRE